MRRKEETDEMEEHLKHTPKGGRRTRRRKEGRKERKGEPPPRRQTGRIGFNGFHPDRGVPTGEKGNVDESNGSADGKRVKRVNA